MSCRAQARAQPHGGGYDSPGVPTPYRAMMRHLLGGDYHSPGAGSDAWSSPVRASPTSAGEPCDAASEGSPATPAARLAGQQQQQQSPGDEGPVGAAARPPSSETSALPVSDAAEQVPASAEPCRAADGPSALMGQPHGEAEERAPHSVAQPKGAFDGDASGVSAGHPSDAGELPTGGESLLEGTAQPAVGAAPEPLSAIPARLQGRAVAASPSAAADSPGAWALVLSPGSELGTPTAGELAWLSFVQDGATDLSLSCSAC